MSSVSRACSGRRITPGPSASAASTSARLVIDFEPGTVTTASTGPPASGAGQPLVGLVAAVRVEVNGTSASIRMSGNGVSHWSEWIEGGSRGR